MNRVEDVSAFKERAYKLCQEFLGGAWKTISLEELRFNVVTGGLSNKLFYCALPENCAAASSKDDVPKDALLRIYGPLLNDHQDLRLQEITIFSLLSERKLGPKLYGLFSDGRLEEYIPSRTLKFNELAAYSTSIAKEIAKMHAIKLPIRKEPRFPSQVYEWLGFAEMSVGPNSTNRIEKIVQSGEVRRELGWVTSEIEKLNCPVVFCHNDLQGNNMLLLDSPKSDDRNLLLIDFEFGAYNYRAIDLAHHLGARCMDFGLKEDFTFYCFYHFEDYPTESQQIEFVNSYLNQLQKEGISFGNDLKTERNKLLKEISVSRMAVLLQGIAGVFKFSSLASANIPYLEFAEELWKLYQTSKEEHLSNC